MGCVQSRELRATGPRYSAFILLVNLSDTLLVVSILHIVMIAIYDLFCRNKGVKTIHSLQFTLIGINMSFSDYTKDLLYTRDIYQIEI